MCLLLFFSREGNKKRELYFELATLAYHSRIFQLSVKPTWNTRRHWLTA